MKSETNLHALVAKMRPYEKSGTAGFVIKLWADELAALLLTAGPQETPVITSETSDGYHTFRELYDYRKAYNALLVNEWALRGLYDVHKAWRHSDGEPCFGGGWFVVVAQTPCGQISNHYKDEDWTLFQVPERDRGDEWDGHTPQVALERLLHLAAQPPIQEHRQVHVICPQCGTPFETRRRCCCDAVE